MDVAEAERAKSFCSQLDVEVIFRELMSFVASLRDAIIRKTASDREYIQAMNIILESEIQLSSSLKNDSFEEVLISEEILAVSVADSHCTVLKLTDGPVPEDISHGDSSSSRNLELGSENSQTSSSSRNDCLLTGKSDLYDPVVLLSPSSLSLDENLAPVSPFQVSYQHHECGPTCTLHLPKHVEPFLGQNPLRVPLLCRFQRNLVRSLEPDSECQKEEEELDLANTDVIYKAPCGRGLRCMDDILRFLEQTKSLNVLQLLNFSFDPQVIPERMLQNRITGPPSSQTLSDRDISRGIEAVPVPLCNELDSVRPKEFRYRKERWPHGCFLSTAPFFSAACDCTDGCTDAQSCSCLQLSLKAGAQPHQLYAHQRLDEPVSTGLYECGPWCSCEKNRCQNRLVQRGLRVRLQVFRTRDRGWGVRCRDDLDKGTFVCSYAGVVLRLGRGVEEQLHPKNAEEEPVSDDEVEVVEEWTLSAGEKKTLYVPVIQRPSDQASVVPDGDKDQTEQADQERETDTYSSQVTDTTENKEQNAEEKVARKKPRLDISNENGEIRPPFQTLSKGDVQKQGSQEQMYYLDASKEGNVSRFFNHSCFPNLFVQNVFVDTHDPKFPVIAFFTSRAIKAGTELTWNYSYEPDSDPEHEVPCLCSWDNCQEIII